MSSKNTVVTTDILDKALTKVTDDILGEMRHFMNMMSDRFDQVDRRMDGLDFRLQRLEDRMDRMEKEMAAVKKSINDIYNILDRIEKRQEITEDERQVMAHQLRQVHDWIFQAAQRIGVEFPLQQ